MAVTGWRERAAHRQGRAGGEAGRDPVIDQRLRQAGAAQRLEPVGGLQHDRAVGAAADHRLLLAHRAGRQRGPAQMDAAAERAVEQAFGREQIGVAVALDDPVGKAA